MHGRVQAKPKRLHFRRVNNVAYTVSQKKTGHVSPARNFASSQRTAVKLGEVDKFIIF